MAWITVDDVTDVFPSASPTENQIAHVQGLAEAVIGEQDEPVGNALKSVMVEIVHRFWRATVGAATSPQGYQSERVDDYEYQYPAGGPLLSGFGLTKKDEKDLRRAVGETGLWIQPTTRGPVETPSDTRTFNDPEFDVV